jgi:hypothetical protein
MDEVPLRLSTAYEVITGLTARQAAAYKEAAKLDSSRRTADDGLGVSVVVKKLSNDKGGVDLSAASGVVSWLKNMRFPSLEAGVKGSLAPDLESCLWEKIHSNILGELARDVRGRQGLRCKGYSRWNQQRRV